MSRERNSEYWQSEVHFEARWSSQWSFMLLCWSYSVVKFSIWFCTTWPDLLPAPTIPTTAGTVPLETISSALLFFFGMYLSMSACVKVDLLHFFLEQHLQSPINPPGIIKIPQYMDTCRLLQLFLAGMLLYIVLNNCVFCQVLDSIFYAYSHTGCLNRFWCCRCNL